ncbi:hypothetical protein CQJ94_20160 [Glycomyces fuscus]|nr:hypothetical protein CQJ94_20160 [Glycomyces fuscus]
MPIRTTEASALAQHAQAVLYQHRLVTSHQLARMFTPQTTSRRYMLHVLHHHQQYLSDAKNPAGYRGIGGTGASCPIGVAPTE